MDPIPRPSIVEPMFEKELKAKGKQLEAGGSEAGYNSSAFHFPEAADLLLLRSRSNPVVSGMLYAIPQQNCSARQGSQVRDRKVRHAASARIPLPYRCRNRNRDLGMDCRGKDAETHEALAWERCI